MWFWFDVTVVFTKCKQPRRNATSTWQTPKLKCCPVHSPTGFIRQLDLWNLASTNYLVLNALLGSSLHKYLFIHVYGRQWFAGKVNTSPVTCQDSQSCHRFMYVLCMRTGASSVEEDAQICYSSKSYNYRVIMSGLTGSGGDVYLWTSNSN